MSSELSKELEMVTSKLTSFTTNQGNNTLENKLRKILQRSSDSNGVKYFDVLVGYFRMSGLNKFSDLLNSRYTRILVGINTEKKVLNAIDLLKTTTEEIVKDLQEEIDNEQDDNVRLLLQLLKDKKLEIAAVVLNNNHSKLYIYRNENSNENNKYNDLQGGVIVGSSNLTQNGLVSNFETNIVIENAPTVDEATQLFNVLWNNSEKLEEKDIDKTIIKKLKNYPLKSKEIIHSYNDLFLQTLICYFDDIIDNSFDFHSKIKLFKYQIDAVNSAILKLNKYNGAILGDVVGLGKTIIAIALLKKLNYTPVIIAPPATHQQWKDTLKEFNIVNYQISTYNKLPQNTTNADIIVIDESHKLKESKSSRYADIQELCKFPFRKKVLLLSATLQNNSPQDIANQVYLFQDKNSSNLPNIVSLEDFFRPLIKKFKLLKEEKSREKTNEILKDISSQVKEHILKPLLIRRTRKDITSYTMYKTDIEKFPEINKPKSLEYKLGGLSDNFKKTLEYLNTYLTYERFRVLNNLNDHGKAKYRVNNPTISDNIFNDNDLSTLAKYSFIKRFESSLYAFKESIKRAILSLEQFIDDLTNNKLFIGKDSKKFLDRKNSKYEYIFDGNQIYYTKETKTKTEKIYLKGTIICQNDIKNPTIYIEALANDLQYLKNIRVIWANNDSDPKFDKFIEVLHDVPNNKIVVFTEYTDTLEYLEEQFSKHKMDKTLFITSSNREENEEKIAQNFDANTKIKKDDYKIIITTDTLAEGVNLHRSDFLINYDLPWNSTKLMQRMGRINRIGSQFDEIHVSNFKPVDESNKVIGLLEKSFIKLQSFHYTLGEDSQILFDDEIVESFGVEKDIDEELIYLQIVRDFKKNNLEKFEQLQSQEVAHSLYYGEEEQELSFFKVANISYFYKKINEGYKSINFLSFIKNIENKTVIKDIDSKIDDTINYHINSLYQKDFIKNNLKNKLLRNDRLAIGILKEWYQDDNILDKDLYNKIRTLLESKSSTKLTQQIMSLKNKNNDEIISELSKFKMSSTTNIELIDKKDIRTKIFIKMEIK